MKRLFVVILVLLVVGLPLALLGAAALAIDDLPTITASTDISPDSVARARALLQEHDPRTASDGQLRTVVLNGRELEDLANYAVSRVGRGGVAIRLQPREMLIQASLPLPDNPFGAYLNLSALLGETSGLPLVEDLRVGRLPVPNWVANYAVRYAARRFSESPGEAIASDTLRSVTVGEGLLRVEYEWRADLPDRITALAISPEEVERLRQYNNQVADTADRLERGASLTELLRPVMQLASERSASGDAIAENRAAIVTVAFYVIGRGLGAVVPGAREWVRPIPLGLRLHGRNDLPKHFMLSAAVAVTADTPLSNAVGLYKEVDDSRGGSGFSFTDIVADRAGTIFGRHAGQSEAAARDLQTRAAASMTEPDILPSLDGLADAMSEPEFLRRFGGLDSPAYAQVMQEIEQRLSGCALLQ